MIRFLVAGILLLLTGIYVMLNPPENFAVGRGVLASCPTSFGDWDGAELSFEDAVVEELKADDLLIRRYRRGNDQVWLCIVYHQHRRYGAHDPRVCYESQGYIVEPETRARIRDGTLAGLQVNRFVADRQRDRRVVYYWWNTQGLATADVTAFRRTMALSGALENRSWGAFVRVETLVHEHRDAAADSVVSAFASEVARALPTVFDETKTARTNQP